MNKKPVSSARRRKGHINRRKLLIGIAVPILLIASFFIERAGLFHKWSVALGVEQSYAVADGTLEAHFLDVGNADSAFVICDGKTLLIDAGERSAGSTVAAYLKRYGVTRLDYLLITHPDADHIGGMGEVVETFEVGQVLLSYMPAGFEPTTYGYESLLQSFSDRNIPVTDVTPGTDFPLGGATITILGPVEDSEDTNSQSVICRITHGSHRLLFTGDAGEEEEASLLAAGVDLRADVLKVSHHGSGYSSTAEFLEAVGARFGVISCGKGNEYGHPDPKTLQRLQAAGVTVYRTDRMGTVTVISDGTDLTVKAGT